MPNPATLTESQVRQLYAKALGPAAHDELLEWASAEKPSKQTHRSRIVPTTAVWIALDCGLRLSELQACQWADLEMTDDQSGTMGVRTAKRLGKPTRWMPIPDDLVKYLGALRAVYGRDEMACNPFILGPLDATQPVTARTLQRGMARVMQEAIGIHVNPHRLRHTFATELIERTDVETVRDLLGHTSLTSTQIYLHTTDRRKRQAIVARSASRCAAR